MLDWMEDYQQGRAIPELGWKAIAKKATVTYSGYLSFTRSPLDASDLTRLTARGLTAQRLDPVIDPERCTIGKLLTDDSLYSNVNQLSSESTKLLYDFRQNPKKYLTIKFQLF